MSAVTAVVGAGPAGLLFCVITRLLLSPDADWTVRVFDKRTEYVRTHRLRMAPEPYRELAALVDDPRFDAILEFLEAERFKPEVNALEARLAGLATELGILVEQREIGATEGSLEALRDALIADGTLAPGQPWTVVGADSVHSAVRELVRGEVEPSVQTHEQLVRVRLTGPGLPEELGVLEQYRWSKLLGSLLDYRLNRNGFAEIDLFLDRREHSVLATLGAVPREPIPLTDAVLARMSAPLFTRIARQLRRGFGAGPCELELYSAFRLEHAVMPRRVFQAAGATVFLVGDAAVSLPFFRGMACLGRCVASLARVHAELAHGADVSGLAERYQRETEAVIARELVMVSARGRLIHAGREFARISAMLPFPMQRWWLSLDVPDRRPTRLTAGVALNALLALPPAAIALVAPLLDAHLWEPLGWLWLIALPLQMLGGAAYYAVRAFEPPNRALGWVWRLQILVLLGVGPAVTALNSWALGHPAQLHSLISWWILGVAFAVGLVAFERLQRSLWSRAELAA